MKGVDLSIFQFDWDLTWHMFFLNGDGTIYGRYGTRAGPRNNQTTHVSVPALKKTMQRALKLHEEYPANRGALAGKRGAPLAYSMPKETPELKKHSAVTTAQNCIHCHMVGESLLRLKRRQLQVAESDIWAYPLPENIGVKMEPEDDLRVRRVLPDSPAAEAGLRVGDELREANGQPLISQADIQWALHNVVTESSIAITLMRDGQTVTQRIDLSGGWKRRDKSWSDTAWGLRPGLQLECISNSARQQAGITGDAMALRVRYAFREAAKAGLRPGDIVTAVDGKTSAGSEEDFLAHIYLQRPLPESVKLTIRRKDQTLDLTLPIK